jgi:hypothetical protein
MTHPYITQALADERYRELRTAASGSRLARIAQCCKPSRIARAVSRLRARLAERTGRGQSIACCA